MFSLTSMGWGLCGLGEGALKALSDASKDLCSLEVNKVEWYPGDYGHFSSLSSCEKTLKLWDPNKGRIMEAFNFDESCPRDHSPSAHQPIIAVAFTKEIRLIDLRTGYTGQKFRRPKQGLDRVRNCCHRSARPLVTSATADTTRSLKRSHVPSSDRNNKKRHSYPSMPQKSPSNSTVDISPSSRSTKGSLSTPMPNSRIRDSPSRPNLRNKSRENSSFLERSNQILNNGSSNSWSIEVQRRQVSRAPASGNIFGADYDDGVSCVSFHPTMPSALAAGYTDGAVVMWDVRSSRSYLFNLMDHYPHGDLWPERMVRGLRYSSDGRHLVSFTRDNVLLWDGYTGEPLGDSSPLFGSAGRKLFPDINDVKISAASKCLFVCVNTRVHSFDLPSGTEIAHFSGHMQSVKGLVIDHSQHRLFTYGRDAHFITWSFHAKEPYVNVKKNDSSELPTARTMRPHENDNWSPDEDSD